MFFYDQYKSENCAFRVANVALNESLKPLGFFFPVPFLLTWSTACVTCVACCLWLVGFDRCSLLFTPSKIFFFFVLRSYPDHARRLFDCEEKKHKNKKRPSSIVFVGFLPLFTKFSMINYEYMSTLYTCMTYFKKLKMICVALVPCLHCSLLT